MSIRRVRLGEWVAILGAAGLLVTLFLEWFALERAAGSVELAKSGWSGVGWLLAVLLAGLIVSGAAVAVTAALEGSPSVPVAAAVVSVTYGALVVTVLAVALALQPDLGAGAPNALVDVEMPALIGLLCAALVPVGGWIALDDERTDAPESAYTPPPARPVPGT